MTGVRFGKDCRRILPAETLVTKTIPNHLRVHRGPAQTNPIDLHPAKDSVKHFWQAYTEATGWRIDSATESQKSNLLPATDAGSISGTGMVSNVPSVNKTSAQRLAETATILAEQLEETREALRLQSVELSARAAIVGEQDRGALAETIAATLADATAACECDAAAIYLLDDDTQVLATRSVHGMPETKMSDPVRDLRGSRGDLEAMVQGVVLISDVNASGLDTWNCPEPASSAICAAIMNSGVPIGTIWMYSGQRRSFDASHEAAAKMASSIVAMKLSRAVETRSVAKSHHANAIGELAQWQFASLPAGTRLAPGWRVDGMIESPRDWATGWHTWDVLPDGSLMIAIAEADDASIGGAMTATVARTALSAHTSYRHTPKQLLQRISDTLWQTNTLDQLTSLLYARIDPETGEGEVAMAGQIEAMIASRYGYRPVSQSNASPLASQLDVNTCATTFRMMAGEVFMAHTRGMQADGVSQMTLGNRLKASMQVADSCPLASVRQSIANVSLKHERGAVTILREA